jgi:hypothetical protein
VILGDPQTYRGFARVVGALVLLGETGLSFSNMGLVPDKGVATWNFATVDHDQFERGLNLEDGLRTLMKFSRGKTPERFLRSLRAEENSLRAFFQEVAQRKPSSVEAIIDQSLQEFEEATQKILDPAFKKTLKEYYLDRLSLQAGRFARASF